MNKIPNAFFSLHFVLCVRRRRDGAAPPERIAQQQLALLDKVVQLGLSLRSAPDRQQHLERGLAELYCESLREHGSLLSREAIVQLLEPDISLNASGMGVWLDRLD